MGQEVEVRGKGGVTGLERRGHRDSSLQHTGWGRGVEVTDTGLGLLGTVGQRT